jgi:toxin YhaV
MVVNGWTLLFHEAIIGQVKNLADAYERARIGDPKGFRSNANIKLLAALAKLVLEIIPGDPSRPEYRQGNTLGGEYRHWLRAKFFGRFRLFFRYDSRSRLIVYAWVNDESHLAQARRQERSLRGVPTYARVRESAERLGCPREERSFAPRRNRAVAYRPSRSL